MWHYAKDDHPVGPIEETDLETLIRDGEVDGATRVWREGMPGWRPAIETELASRMSLPVPVVAGPPAPAATLPAADARGARPAGSPDLARKLQYRFTLWWLFLLLGAPLALVFVGYGLLVASTVFQFMLLHGLWSVVQDGRARTTPGKAVGFHFIPFFNLYWLFVAHAGLAKELNRVRREEAPGAPASSEGLALAYCILVLCSVIPLINIVTGIGALVTLFMSMARFKSTAIGILEARSAAA